MNNLTIAILTKVTSLVQTSGTIAKVADKLLNHILLQENAAAQTQPIVCLKPRTTCGGCINGFKLCRRCCQLSLLPPQCYYFRIAC